MQIIIIVVIIILFDKCCCWFAYCYTGNHDLFLFFRRFLATGSTYHALAFEFRMGKSTVAEIVSETCEAIWKRIQPLCMPVPDQQLCLKIANCFNSKWNFPNCFGAVDGKHIRVKCPPKTGSLNYNYEQFFSVMLQAVADHECKFVCIDVGALVKQSEGGIFRASDLFKCLQDNTFGSIIQKQIPGTELNLPLVLVGDEAYPLLPHLMRPFPRKNLDEPKRIFNYRLSRARRFVECAFGIMTAKFGILENQLEQLSKTPLAS